MEPNLQNNQRSGGYTLIEALVSSSVLLIGIAAAASMSLAMVTQEEMNERSAKAFTYLDNAARLYQMGVEPAYINNLLPSEPVVLSMSYRVRNIAVTGLGNVPATTITMVYKPSSATGNSGFQRWTGGDKDVTRSESIEVIRSNSFVSEPLPRVVHYTP